MDSNLPREHLHDHNGYCGEGIHNMLRGFRVLDTEGTGVSEMVNLHLEQ